MQTTDTFSQPKTMAAAAATMASYAMSRGVPIEEILTKLEINPLELMAPDSRVQEEVFPKIMNMMAASLPDEAFALDLAKIAPFSILGFVSSAIEFAPTFRDGLEILVQYKSVLSDRLSLHYSIREEDTLMEIHHPMDEMDRGVTAEFGLALWFRMVEEHYGVAGLVKHVQFAHKPQVAHSLYEDYFGTKVLFEQSSNGFLLDNRSLDCPSRVPSQALYDFARAHLDQMQEELGKGSARNEEMQKVYDAICENAARAEYGATALAEKLNMSLRSLQRLVSQNGSELREMLDEVREANAKALLAKRELGIDNVAYMLGYSDERAFRRSFKRWVNLTPSEYRKGLDKD